MNDPGGYENRSAPQFPKIPDLILEAGFARDDVRGRKQAQGFIEKAIEACAKRRPVRRRLGCVPAQIASHRGLMRGNNASATAAQNKAIAVAMNPADSIVPTRSMISARGCPPALALTTGAQHIEHVARLICAFERPAAVDKRPRPTAPLRRYGKTPGRLANATPGEQGEIVPPSEQLSVCLGAAREVREHRRPAGVIDGERERAITAKVSRRKPTSKLR
jgi:hypothetical protein